MTGVSLCTYQLIWGHKLLETAFLSHQLRRDDGTLAPMVIFLDMIGGRHAEGSLEHRLIQAQCCLQKEENSKERSSFYERPSPHSLKQEKGSAEGVRRPSSSVVLTDFSPRARLLGVDAAFWTSVSPWENGSSEGQERWALETGGRGRIHR